LIFLFIILASVAEKGALKKSYFIISLDKFDIVFASIFECLRITIYGI
jgi:hypothetical protein